MKHKVVQVKNVVRTENIFESLTNRSAIIPGMALVHGDSGYGKTTAMSWLFNQDGVNAIFTRCFSTDTPTSVLERICKELGIEARYPLRKMVDDIIERMRNEELALFVDECDYVVSSLRIMETFRDIYDATEQPVVLIGMDQIAKRISHRKQIFNRLSEWVQFEPADLEDVALFADELLEHGICVEEDLLNAIRKRAHGEVRRILTSLDKIERKALASGIDRVSLLDIDERELFMDPRKR